MAYGMEFKNRTGTTVFGAKHLAIKKVASGFAAPQIYDSRVNTTYNVTSGLRALPTGVNKTNALVFARPQARNQPFHSELMQGVHPMAVDFPDNYPGFIRFFAPDGALSFYRGDSLGTSNASITQSRAYTNSFQNWPTDSTSRRIDIYYEVWTVGQSDDEDDTHGLVINDSGGDIIFSSNRNNFLAESSSYAHRPVQFQTSPLLNINYTDNFHLAIQSVGMEQTSNNSQANYLALLNGTSSCVAIARGGDFNSEGGSTQSVFHIPKEKTAYYNRFVEFHYQDQESVAGFKPAVLTVPRLSRTSDENNEIQYNTQVRLNNQVGVSSLLTIGTSA